MKTPSLTSIPLGTLVHLLFIHLFCSLQPYSCVCTCAVVVLCLVFPFLLVPTRLPNNTPCFLLVLCSCTYTFVYFLLPFLLCLHIAGGQVLLPPYTFLTPCPLHISVISCVVWTGIMTYSVCWCVRLAVLCKTFCSSFPLIPSPTLLLWWSLLPAFYITTCSVWSNLLPPMTMTYLLCVGRGHCVFCLLVVCVVFSCLCCACLCGHSSPPFGRGVFHTCARPAAAFLYAECNSLPPFWLCFNFGVDVLVSPVFDHL